MTISIKNTTALLLTILILLTALTYANTLRNGFVWDDNDIIVNNTVNRNLSNITTLFKSADVVFTDDQRAYYRPLNRLTYLLDYQLFGLNPVGYHFENILLHILSVIALFVVVQKIAGRRSVAFGTALIFALHPINSEAVNFLSGGRNTILATLFTLLAFLAWGRGKETGRSRYRWLAGGLFFLGLLSKETALMLIPLLAIREFRTKESRKNLLHAGRNFIPLAFVALIYLTLRTAALSGVMGEQPFPTGFWSRLLQQVYIIPRYAFNILFPVKLCSYYTLPRNLQEHLPLLVTFWILLVIIIALLLKSKRPATRFGLLWLAVNFIPIAQIIPIPSAPMADRYLYLPAIGIWLIIVDNVYAMVDAMTNRPLRRWLAGAAVCICVVLSVLTWRNNRAWKDDITLNAAILRVEPNSVFAHYNLGGAYKTQGDLDSAASAWEQTVQLDPKHSHALNQLGTHHLLKGRPAEALTYFTRAIAANPNNAVAHYNRAMVLEGLDRTGEAAEEYQNFLSIIPDEHVTLIPDITARITRLRQSPRKEVR